MKAIIHVTKRGWGGDIENDIVEAGIGENIEIVKGFGNPSALVKFIDTQHIVLVTSHLAPRKVNAGIDLKGDYSNLETILKIGESAKFSTQTMDAGATYVIALTNIKQ